MLLLDKIHEDLKSALIAHEEIKVSIIRFVLASITNARIDKGTDLTDAEIVDQIAKEAKRHEESIKAYTAGNRPELAEKEKKELEILKVYMPEPYTEEELGRMVDEAIKVVDATSIVDMGRVVKAVLSSGSARADGARVAELVKAKLS